MRLPLGGVGKDSVIPHTVLVVYNKPVVPLGNGFWYPTLASISSVLPFMADMICISSTSLGTTKSTANHGIRSADEVENVLK